MNCGCGGEDERMKLLCIACYEGELDMVKKLVVQQKVNPNGKLYLARVKVSSNAKYDVFVVLMLCTALA